MAKKRKKPVIIKVSVDLSYVSTFFNKRDSNGCDHSVKGEFARAQVAHTDITDKKIMRSVLRSNFSIKFNTTNKTINEILLEIEDVKQSKEIKKLIELSRKLTKFIDEKTNIVYPGLKDQPPRTIDTDWHTLLTFDKKDLEYRTNVYNHMSVDDWEIEHIILDILQEFVDNNLDIYVALHCSYNCWHYYIGNDNNYTLKEFIDHRRENLKHEEVITK